MTRSFFSGYTDSETLSKKLLQRESYGDYRHDRMKQGCEKHRGGKPHTEIK